MERKRSFYGRVSSAILEPVATGNPNTKAPRDNLAGDNLSQERNDLRGNGSPSDSERDESTATRFRYRFNPRLLAIDDFAARANQAEPGSDLASLPTSNSATPASAQDATEAPEDQECVVCAEEKHAGNFTPVTARCGHRPGTCRDCVKTSIRSDLDNKRWVEIKCPECDEKLEYTDVHKFADHATFGRFEALALRAAMEGQENFRWCPCGSGQVHESGRSQPIMTCLHCGAKRCFRHDEAWHHNMSCDEYDELIADPENFRSKFELGATTEQEDEDNELARGLWAREEEAMRRRKQQEQEERRRAKEAADAARKIAAQRKKEEEKSAATASTANITGVGVVMSLGFQDTTITAGADRILSWD